MNAELDLKSDVGEPEESTSPPIKHSARSLGSKLMKGLTPRRSMLAILTPRSRSNQVPRNCHPKSKVLHFRGCNSGTTGLTDTEDLFYKSSRILGLMLKN